MRIKFRGIEHDFLNYQDASSLQHALLLDFELRKLNLGMRYKDFEALNDRLSEMPAKEAKEDPDFLIWTVFVVWHTLRMDKVGVTFEQLLREIGDVDFIEEPGDAPVAPGGEPGKEPTASPQDDAVTAVPIESETPSPT